MSLDFKLIFLFVFVFISCQDSNHEKAEQEPFYLNWVRDNSTEILSLDVLHDQTDLQALTPIVGEASVVCLGESRHDIREQFLLKHRFIKFLVKEHGFRTFILESSFPFSQEINKYLQTGNENIIEILASMPDWFLWDNLEILELLRWMRSFNLNSPMEDNIHFFGMDVVSPIYGLEKVKNYLKKVDPQLQKQTENQYFGKDIINDEFWMISMREYASLPPDTIQLLKENYAGLHTSFINNEQRYISRSSAKEFEWMKQISYSIKQANDMFSGKSRIEIGLTRDKAMAENVKWILKETDKKAIIWSHNVHIAKSEFNMSGEQKSIKGMGAILQDSLGEKLVSIGASFNRGVFEDYNIAFMPAHEKTMDGVLARLNKDFLLVNLDSSGASIETKNWLQVPKILRGQDFEMTCILPEAFDAIFFIDGITRTNPSPSSIARLKPN